MRTLKHLASTALLVGLAANAGWAGTNAFQLQAITLPFNATATRFADVDNDRRADLLALDPVEKRLLIYHQRDSGFTNAPDQAITLPPQTAWIAPYDVEAQPGLELLMSTDTGLVYHRQHGGIFESELRTLITAEQVFTHQDTPLLLSLATNAAIPVISATQAVLYERNAAFAWQPGPPLALASKKTTWSARRDDWTLGPHAARSLHIQQSLQAKPENVDENKSETDKLKQLLDDLKQSTPQHEALDVRVDLDGDGRKDLVVWQLLGEMEPRTDVYVFLRGPDGQLPDRPTQVLHCHGFPLPVGNTRLATPIADLNGDGKFELLLVEVKVAVTSASSVMEMALTRGVDMALTIRSFDKGAFSRRPDASVLFTAMMTLESLEEWSLFICGDFNGDGRPDLVVRRSASQWNIFPSTGAGRRFAPQPTMTFETPMPGYFEFSDLNGDGRADIVLRAKDDPRIFLFLSKPERMKDQP